MKRRVVVTGLGVVSSIGIGKEQFYEALMQGKSGIAETASFDTSGYDRHRGGEIKNFNPGDFMDTRQARRLGRTSQLAIAAAGMAFKDTGENPKEFESGMTAIILGTTMGEIHIFEALNKNWLTKSLKSVNTFFIPHTTPYSMPVNLGIYYGITGMCMAIPTACASGNYAIGYGYDLVKEGKVNMAVVGGVDSFSRLAFAGFSRLYAMSPDNCQPFDKNRKGMLVGEGSAVLILESLENALKKKKTIYAEVLGYGLSCDASHMTIPSNDGIARCMENALKETGLSAEGIDYISAHGTGTVQNDKNECAAIKRVFGQHYKKVLVSSIKSMLGHCMGAASALEAVACCFAVSRDIVPPTINYQTPDPECDIDCVPNQARKTKIKIAFNNAYAFGGNNACVVFKKYEG